MKKNIIYVLAFLFLQSCQESSIDDNIKEEVLSNKDFTIKDGKFSFNSKEELEIKINSFKRKNRKTKEKVLKEFYEKGFLPLEPIVNINDRNLLEKISSRKKLMYRKTRSYRFNKFDWR